MSFGWEISLSVKDNDCGAGTFLFRAVFRARMFTL
jgi:hypothetical protein